MTIYKLVSRFPNYRVGDDGSLWRRRNGVWVRIPLKAKPADYPSVSLRNGELRRKTHIHVLVLEAFVGPRPRGQYARHFPDKNRHNNAITNLSWSTPTVNALDKFAQGSRVGRQKITDQDVRVIYAMAAEGALSLTEIGRRFCLARAQVCEIVYATSWRHLGLAPLPRRGKAKGSRHYMSHLTESDVRKIRKGCASGQFTRREAAARFRVSYWAICNIMQGRIWKHVSV